MNFHIFSAKCKSYFVIRLAPILHRFVPALSFFAWFLQSTPFWLPDTPSLLRSETQTSYYTTFVDQDTVTITMNSFLHPHPRKSWQQTNAFTSYTNYSNFNWIFRNAKLSLRRTRYYPQALGRLQITNYGKCLKVRVRISFPCWRKFLRSLYFIKYIYTYLIYIFLCNYFI